MATIIDVKYYNSFMMKKAERSRTPIGTSSQPVWPGLPWNPFGQPAFPLDAAVVDTASSANFYIEEARIKGGFNNQMVSQGVRAYLNEESPDQDTRQASLIYSGVYNSRTDINQTNVFSVGEPITKSLDPSYGSIQKLFAEETNLTIFQEDKVSQALIDKDAIYSAEGQGQPVSTQNLVIGQVVPYLGRYGIGKNPESFAQFGFRKYFVDPIRATVMRLSRDGLTEISEYGMKDFFRDNLTALDNNIREKFIDFTVDEPSATAVSTFEIMVDEFCNVLIGSKVYESDSGDIIDLNTTVTSIEPVLGSPAGRYTLTVDSAIVPPAVGLFSYNYKTRILGGWDNHNRYYTVSLQPTPTYVNSDSDYYTLSFDEKVKGWVSFFTYKPSFMFSLKGNYYSTIDYSLYLHYRNTLDQNYNNFYGQQSTSFLSFVVNASPSMKKVFQTVNYEGDNGWYVRLMSTDTTSVDIAPNEVNSDGSGVIYSYNEGLYTDPISGYPMRAGFNRKENLYVANIKNSSLLQNEQVLFSNTSSGLKGYFLNVVMQTDATTDPGGAKELWSVGTKFIQSS